MTDPISEGEPPESLGVLAGIRVLELGHYVAAPFCTRLMGDLGAEIIKVEPPNGDPVRQWGEQVEGRSLWWSVHGRNKKSISIDLKTEAGRALVLDLVEKCDVVVENFRPGQLERMGLGKAVLQRRRPDIIVAHISGYGQTGPGRDQAAFGVIGEAVGGIRYLTNHSPGETNLPPVRVGVSIGDSVAGLYAAFGIISALWRKARHGSDPKYQTVDVALTESILSLMEGMLPEYGKLGKIKQPTGGGIATAAPSNAYPTSDDQWILIAANSEPLFAKLLTLMGRDDLQDDPRFQGNAQRVSHSSELDMIISDWSHALSASNIEEQLKAADIPATRVYTAAEIAEDAQYRARAMVREVQDPHLGMVLHPGIVPHFPAAPGNVRSTGPDIGVDGESIAQDLLGYDATTIAELRANGVML